MSSKRFVLYTAVLCLLAAVPCRAAMPEPESITLNRVVAVVNGEMITSYDLEMASTPDLMQARIDPRNPAHAGRMQEIMRENLEKMISDIIVVQEAERMRISATANDVDAELQTMAKRAEVTEEELMQQLVAQGMKPEFVRERLRKRILQQRLLANMVGRKVIVSQDEIAKYFEEQGGVITLPGKVAFAVIVYPPNVNAQTWAERIASGKVGFAEAVRQVSIGPQRANGGQLAMMNEQDVLPHIRRHLDPLGVGEVSPLFEMEGMKTQLKCTERVPGERLTTLEAAAPHIEDRLRNPRLEQRYNEYLEQLRKKALVEIRL